MEKIRMEYCGIGCIGSIDDIIENVSWLWSLDIPPNEYRVIKLDYSFLVWSLHLHITSITKTLDTGILAILDPRISDVSS